MSITNGGNATRTTNAPLYSFASLVLFVVASVVLYVTGRSADASLFLALVVTTIPSLVASFSAERAARDIRNGVVEERAKRGATAAIEQAGVVVRDGPVVQAQLAANAAQLAALNQTLSAIHGTAARTENKVDKLGEPLEALVQGSDKAPPT